MSFKSGSQAANQNSRNGITQITQVHEWIILEFYLYQLSWALLVFLLT